MAIFNTWKKSDIYDIFKDCDAFLLTSHHNIRYLTGFTGSLAYCLISPDSAYIFVDGRYTEQAKDQTKDIEVITYRQSIGDALSKFSFRILGLEFESLSYSQYKNMESIFKGTSFVDVSSDFHRIRTTKTEDEIKYISQSASLVDLGFSHIKDYIKPGVRERDVAAELEYFLKKNGADAMSFSTIVGSGSRGSYPHVTPSDKVIENGDCVVIDFGCVLNGYCSDMTRTVFVGEIPEDQHRVYSVVLESQIKALEYCKVGSKACDVEKICRQVMKNHNLESFFVHSLGHGVGVEIHEFPRISSRSSDVLAENMVFTIEPGIYIEGKFGVRIEDLVMLTKDGLRFLSSSPKSADEMVV